MRIDGEWLLCDDGVVRPVIHGALLTGHGTWRPVPFLVDTGADRTVLSASVLAALALPSRRTPEPLGGVGGMVTSVVVTTRIRFRREADLESVILRGDYAAFVEPEALDICVLGRDITRLFALIVDQPGQVVCLLGQRHQYTITSG